MNLFSAFIAIGATISLFIFSLRGFSGELQTLGAERLRSWLSKVTSNKISGFFLGALLTALIQSSSVVTSITVAMVDAGVISFFNSLPVLVGANLGSTFTAWLVAFKIDNLGSWLLIIGMLVSVIPYKIHLAGKSIFYLGLILFSLHQISLALTPVSGSPEILKWLSEADTIPIGILAGIFITTIVQSSSVTTGLTIILAGQGLLSLDGAIAVVIGSNLGTTSTALIAALSLSVTAKRSAMANFLINLGGLVLFLPFVHSFAGYISTMNLEITYQVAVAHLIFNIIVAAIALPFLKHLSGLVSGYLVSR